MTPWLRTIIAIGCGLGVCAAGTGAPALSAVEGRDQDQPFRTRINAVTLDVTVLDKSGRAITDLTAADFEVTERGKPQTVQQFELVDMDKRPPMSSNLYHAVRTMESMEQEVARRDSRLIVVFLDDYHIRRLDQYQVQLQVADVVRDLDPRDLVAVMYPLTPTSGLSWSRDHDADARRIAKFEGRQGDYFPPQNVIEENMLKTGKVEKYRREAVWTALRGLCTHLGTLRDTRKSVLYVSTWAPGGIEGFAFDEYRQIQQAAAKGNVAFYPYDPRGLLVGRSLGVHDWFKAMADGSGGRAIVNVNDGRRFMNAIITDSSAYYLLGYSSTEDPRDGKFHPVKVKVKRPGVEVLARDGYWAFDAEAVARAATPLPPPVDPDVNAALEAAEAPELSRPFRAWAGADRDASGRAIVTVVWESTGSEPIEGADVAAVSASTSFRGRAPRDTAAPRVMGTVSFPAAAETVDVRVTARTADGPIDAAVLKVSVPDPGALGIGTPVFFHSRISRDLVRADARPTTQRLFNRDEQVAVRVHAWTPAAGSPAVSARLLSDHGELLLEIPASAIDRAKDTFSVTLPVSSLGLGRYVTEITATDATGATTKVLAAFRVR